MTDRGIGWAAGMLTRLSAVKRPLREAIVDCLAGQPRAVDYDPSDRSRTPWCWTHERSVSACHKAGLLCDGEVIESHDPTGETAVGFDPAAQALKDLDHLERQIVTAVLRYDDLRRQYLPTQAELPSKEARAKLATEGQPPCFFCDAHGLPYSPACTAQPTTVTGNLTVARFICRGHYTFVRNTGRAPTRQESEHWHTRGKWPKVKAA